MGLREDFYQQLRWEFENGRRDSFLYRYLKQERRDHPREDDYARLERCYALLERGQAGQRDYLTLALQVLIKNDRLPSGGARELLLDYGRALGGAELFQGKRRDREKYAALLAALEAGEPAWPMAPKAVQALHQELLSAILCRDAQTYLYDAGRKRDRDMAMLEAYCEDQELALGPRGTRSTAPLTGQELEQWEALFETLRWEEDRRGVLIPIRIDPWTGAGLFIVGSAYYPKKFRRSRDRKAACYYAYFYLDDLMAQEYVRKGFRSFDISLVFRCLQEELEGMRDLPSLDEAQKAYRHMLAGDDAVGLYQQRNGSPPEGCPRELLRFFDTESSPAEDLAALAPEGREVYLQETGGQD